MKQCLSILLLLCLSPFTVAAISPCNTPEYRQFDFWLGKWKVLTPDGKDAGVNVISKQLKGCVLHEDYKNLFSEFEGMSYNVYDKTRKVWHQTWVDNSGKLLQLDGKLIDGNMVLEGDRINKNGKAVRDRISWIPNKDGTVRQHWELSKDGGKTWKTLYDGLYTKM